MTIVLGQELEVTRQGFKIKDKPIHIVRVPGTKNWYCKIYVKSEKRYKTQTSGTDDLATAVASALALNAEVNIMIKHNVALFSYKFETVVESWLSYMEKRKSAKQVSVHMIRIYNGCCKNHLLPFLGDYQINAVNKSLLEKYIQVRMLANPSENTLSFEKTTLNLILIYAKEQGWYKIEPIPSLEIPTGVKTAERRGVFLDEEVETLLSAGEAFIDKSFNKTKYIRNVLILAIRFMIETGCRTNDLIYLTWQDITWDATNQIYTAILRGKPCKNRKSRQIYFKHNIYFELENWKRSSSNLHIKPTDLVFASEDGSFQALDRDFGALLTFAEIPKQLNGEDRTLYSLRHTYITQKIAEGKTLYHIAKQCGTSIAHIEATYGHLSPMEQYHKVYGKNEL